MLASGYPHDYGTPVLRRWPPPLFRSGAPSAMRDVEVVEPWWFWMGLWGCIPNSKWFIKVYSPYIDIYIYRYIYRYIYNIYIVHFFVEICPFNHSMDWRENLHRKAASFCHMKSGGENPSPWMTGRHRFFLPLMFGNLATNLLVGELHGI